MCFDLNKTIGSDSNNTCDDNYGKINQIRRSNVVTDNINSKPSGDLWNVILSIISVFKSNSVKNVSAEQPSTQKNIIIKIRQGENAQFSCNVLCLLENIGKLTLSHNVKWMHRDGKGDGLKLTPYANQFDMSVGKELVLRLPTENNFHNKFTNEKEFLTCLERDLSKLKSMTKHQDTRNVNYLDVSNYDLLLSQCSLQSSNIVPCNDTNMKKEAIAEKDIIILSTTCTDQNLSDLLNVEASYENKETNKTFLTRDGEVKDSHVEAKTDTHGIYPQLEMIVARRTCREPIKWTRPIPEDGVNDKPNMFSSIMQVHDDIIGSWLEDDEFVWAVPEEGIFINAQPESERILERFVGD